MKQYHKNPRQITHRQYGDLEKWLAQFGDLSGITHNLPTDETITGNQRCRVIDINECEIVIEHKLDEPDEQGTVGLGYVIWQGNRYSYRQVVWDERTAAQANVVANRAGGSWDFDILANEWELSDLLDWGFEESELQLDWGSDEPTPDPGAQTDKADALLEKWGVERGQIFQVGRHKIMCGDSTCAEDVERLSTGEIDLLLSDPPYGIDWDTDYTRFTSGYSRARRKSEKIAGDNKPFDPTPYLDYPCVILFGANFYCRDLPVGTWLVWDKRHPNGTALLSDAELAWMNKNAGVYIYSETWQGVVRSEKIQHPTQKSSGLFRWCIEKSKTTGPIYDPFLGSGTTIVAAEQTGRVGYGMEICEKYVAVSLQRLQDMGLEPQLIEQ